MDTCDVSYYIIDVKIIADSCSSRLNLIGTVTTHKEPQFQPNLTRKQTSFDLSHHQHVIPSAFQAINRHPQASQLPFSVALLSQTHPTQKKPPLVRTKARILKPKRESLNDENSLGYRLSGQRSEGDLRRDGLFLAMAETVRDCPW